MGISLGNGGVLMLVGGEYYHWLCTGIQDVDAWICQQGSPENHRDFLSFSILVISILGSIFFSNIPQISFNPIHQCSPLQGRPVDACCGALWRP
jgi:hypothetical protein